MKKLIAIISIVSALGFAVALANTTSNDNPSDMSGSSDTSGNMSGTVGSDTSLDTSKDKLKKHDKWSSAKTCTDENGVTYYKGRAGFSTCVDKMRKSDQMGGTTPSEGVIKKEEHTTESTIDHPSDSNLPSDSGSSTSSDPGSSTNSNS